MKESINILLLSVGTRNKIVQYFKKELNGRGEVFAADCSKLAPALYEADKYFIVPRISDDNYIDKILDICVANEINAVLSLIDPELSLISLNKERFLEINVLPVVSEYDLIEMCLDKFAFFKAMQEKNINTVKTYKNIETFVMDHNLGNIMFPIFVKPRKGSASTNINRVESLGELIYLFEKYDDLIIQEYMSGQEIGADIYVDLVSRKTSAIFTKRKIKMRAGETDKSVSFIDENLFSFIERILDVFPFIGVLDMDIFEREGKYYISEINPRFGGGYPHAHACEVNLIDFIIKNLKGIENVPSIGNYRENIYMMKFNQTVIRELRNMNELVELNRKF